MTFEDAMDSLGKELTQEKALLVFHTLSNWIESNDVESCFPIALHRIDSNISSNGNWIVISKLEDESEFWDTYGCPIMCNAMYLSPNQSGDLGVYMV